MPPVVAPQKLSAVTKNGQRLDGMEAVDLLTRLAYDAWIIGDDVRWQGVSITKSPSRPLGQRRVVVLFVDTLDWDTLRHMRPGCYHVHDLARTIGFWLEKHPADSDTILLRRAACWLAGTDLDAETEQRLRSQLHNLGVAMESRAPTRGDPSASD